MNPAGWIIIGALALLGVKFEKPAFLQKKPPTAELVASQQQLAQAQAAQAAAEAELAKVRAAAASKKNAQLDYAQQMAIGARDTLHRIQGDAVTPEVQLAKDFSDRAVNGLEAARGKLTPEQQAEVDKLIGNALSAFASEREAYRTAIAAKDRELALATQQRAELQAKVPKLEADLAVKAAEVQAKDATVSTKTAEVVTYANEAAAEKARAGSLDAYASYLLRILAGLAIILILCGGGAAWLKARLSAATSFGHDAVAWAETLKQKAAKTPEELAVIEKEAAEWFPAHDGTAQLLAKAKATLRL